MERNSLLLWRYVSWVLQFILISDPISTYLHRFRCKNDMAQSAYSDSSLLVFFKWPITGILIEFVGFVGLFGYVLLFILLTPSYLCSFWHSILLTVGGHGRR